ncbi:aminotransferase class III-fold pyridoxal phosphate-dependent enzyme [Streptomyces sp. NPDC017943]|uniref:aminotransferase class III-fold pyridoxal phosphate-dependent enzyme n=1 Tax=Streptomyces sp. NPDC017943 TaxID=3365019 RepID=UPI00378F7753
MSEGTAVVCAQVKPTPGGAFDAAVREVPRAPEGSRRRQSARDAAARTYARALPLVPVRARGLTIEGADGRRYLDCTSGAGALALGHNHPVVLEAIRSVLDSGAPLNALDLATPVTEAFLTELHRTLPPGLAHRAHVRFCDPSTGDALETACRWARAATGRTGLMTFTEAHRRAASQPYDPRAAAQPTASLAEVRDLHCPHGLDDGRDLDLAADWAESLLDAPSTGSALPAGVIVEPVQGGGGVLPVPSAWLRRIRQLTADRSIPLIVDETHTGFGRTGAFWAVGDSGVTPDAMILSPDIGGSLPLTVVIQRDDLSGGQPAADTAPFRGNQLAMAAGAATLAHVRENGFAERAAHLGARMLAQLRPLADASPIVHRVRGRGLLIGIDLIAAEEAEESREEPTDADAPGECGAGGRGARSASSLAADLQRECLRRGLIVGLCGQGRSVRLSPPLTISDEQANAVLDRLADAVEAVARVHGAARQQRRHRVHE